MSEIEEINHKRAEIIKYNTEKEAERKRLLALKAQLYEALEDYDAQLILIQTHISISNNHFQALGKRLMELTGESPVQKR